MKNITVAITESAYRDARVWSAKRDTSISAVVQYLLETLPNIQRAAQKFPLTEVKTGLPPAPLKAPAPVPAPPTPPKRSDRSLSFPLLPRRPAADQNADPTPPPKTPLSGCETVEPTSTNAISIVCPEGAHRNTETVNLLNHI